jgi:tripeptidyl-peptidase-1
MITLRVGLKSNNVAGLEAKLRSVSNPGSPDFRGWLSMDEVRASALNSISNIADDSLQVKAFTQPSADTVSAFDAFASANGLVSTVISPNRDWVSITLSVSEANKLFAAEFAIYTHPDLKRTITRTLTVSLPSELVGHVDVIHPTTAFVTPNTRLVSPGRQINARGPAASCNSRDPSSVVTPACLQELYGIPTTPATQTSNALLVTGYFDQWAQSADLAVSNSRIRMRKGLIPCSNS